MVSALHVRQAICMEVAGEGNFSEIDVSDELHHDLGSLDT